MRIIPIAADGWRFIIPFGILAGLFLWHRPWWSTVMGGFFLLLTLFCLYFFRDFERNVIQDENIIACPGDGRVLGVEAIPDGEYAGGQLVRVFLSVLDVHVQRSPITGEVQDVTYKKGKFYDARDPRAHMENEQNSVTISSPKGKIRVTQIAGLIARRCVCWVKKGDQVTQGGHYGLIRFGSQVDVMLPPNAEVLVKEGERVAGGLTSLAKWQS